MASKDDKWVMFINFMHNELGITKEDIREWIDDSVKQVAKDMVEDAFVRKNPEQMIKDAIYRSDYFHGEAFNNRIFHGESFNNRIIEEAAKILAKRLEITIKK